MVNVLGRNAKVDNKTGDIKMSNIGGTGKDNIHDAIASINTNMGNVYNDMGKIRDEGRAGIASAVALGMLPQSNIPGKGYLVPISYQEQIIKKLSEEMFIRRLCKNLTTNSTTNIPISGSVPKFEWIDEKGAYPQVDTNFGNIQIEAHKIGGIIKISEELLEDSFINLESYVINLMVEGLGLAQEEAFIKGDGNKKPKGLSTYDVGLDVAWHRILQGRICYGAWSI